MFQEIYFTIFAKTKHFTALKDKTGFSYESMLFFDDEAKNLTSVSPSPSSYSSSSPSTVQACISEFFCPAEVFASCPD